MILVDTLNKPCTQQERNDFIMLNERINKYTLIEDASKIEAYAFTDEEKQEREDRRTGSFKLTKADFWIACLELNITKSMDKEKLALIPDELLRAKTEIRLDDAEFFYRGDEGLIALAKMFGVTDEQLDVIFKVQ